AIGVPGVRLPADDRQHQLLALRADPDRRVRFLDRSWPVGGVVELIVAALECRPVSRHQQAPPLDAFLEPPRSLPARRKLDSKLLMPGLVPGGAQSELPP